MFPLTPALSLKGEGAVCAGIILWGTLSPIGERGLLGFLPSPRWGEGRVRDNHVTGAGLNTASELCNPH